MEYGPESGWNTRTRSTDWKRKGKRKRETHTFKHTDKV